MYILLNALETASIGKMGIFALENCTVFQIHVCLFILLFYDIQNLFPVILGL